MSSVAVFALHDVTYDSRVQRVASTLAGAGHEVTLFALPRDRATTSIETEQGDGFRVVRVPLPATWREGWVLVRRPRKLRSHLTKSLKARRQAGPRGWPATAVVLVELLVARLWRAVVEVDDRMSERRGPDRGLLADLFALARWRYDFADWGKRVAELAPHASVYHAHGLEALPAALAVRRAHGAGAVVCDSLEILFDSPGYAGRSWWARTILRVMERRWSSRAAALITVNAALADVLRRRVHVRRIVIVHNCPPRWNPPADRTDRLRAAAGLAPGTPVVLYHGRFDEERGLEQLAAAMLEPSLEGAHAVFLGYGPLRDALAAMAVDPRYGGRLHVLDAVMPDDLMDVISTADVSVIALQPPSLNHFLATPNKLFESIGAGLPVVVSDFPAMRPIVLDGPWGALGSVCQPQDPVSVAAAVAAILALDPEARTDLRARCLTAAHERWNWETESQRLLALYADLTASRVS